MQWLIEKDVSQAQLISAGLWGRFPIYSAQ